MTFQISQRGREYLADDYRQRAEKASHVDAAKAFARSAANAEGEGCTSPDEQLHSPTCGRNA
ncbi:MAG: hypothetical protein QOF56_4007 [Acidobacteriaceae bacterium]|nr:hypothetical protein [Acidobacteriaceae bacterium]